MRGDAVNKTSVYIGGNTAQAFICDYMPVMGEDFEVIFYGNSTARNISGGNFIDKNGTSYEFEYSAMTLSDMPNANIYLGHCNGTTTGSSKGFIGKIYSFSVGIKDGELLRNFVPCLNPEGRAGMYDTVSKTFYTNTEDSSSFTAGYPVLFDDYIKLDYIESTGTQYIDTGVNASDYPNGITYNMTTTITSYTEASYLLGALANSTRSGNVTISSDGFLVMVCGGNNESLYRRSFTAEVPLNIRLENVTATDITAMTCYTNGTEWDNAVFERAVSSDMPNANIYFLKCNGSTRVGASCRVYGLTMADAASGKKIREFVPCMTPNGVVGMYDMVGEKFYPSIGTEAFIAGVFAVLPQEYTRLEYIQSTGTQYIDTGINARQYSNGITYDFKGIITSPTSTTTSTTTSSYFMGATANNTRSGNIAITEGGYFAMKCGGNSQTIYQSKITVGEMLNVRLENVTTTDITKMRCYTNGEEWENLIASGVSSAAPSITIYFLNCKGANFAGAQCKVYSFIMTDASTGIKIREFIPCIDPSGEVGMYDLVTQTFFANSGSDTFIAGPEKSRLPDEYMEVEYVYTDGDCYFDTTVIPANYPDGIRIDLDFMVTDYTYINDSRDIYNYYFGCSSNGCSSGNFAYNSYQGNFRLYSGSSSPYIYNWTNILNQRTYISVFSNSMNPSEATASLKIDNQERLAIYPSSIVSNAKEMPSESIYLLGCRGINQKGIIGKCYGGSMYTADGTMIRNFIPCVTLTGIAGLYDTINNKFYANSGTGTLQANRSILPEEYTEVQYIKAEANVGAYFDLGFAFDTKARVESSMYFKDNTSTYPFGATENGGVYRCIISAPYDNKIMAYGSNGTAYLGIGTNYITPDYNEFIGIWEKGKLQIENLSNQTISSGASQVEYTMASSLYLFAQNYHSGVRWGGARQIKYFKYYDKDCQLICNLIPVIRNGDGEIGMYDFATETFFTNVGTGSFVAGPAV